jgi:hypothetical protein
MKKVSNKKIIIKPGDRVTTVHNRELWGTVQEIIDANRPMLKVYKHHRYFARVLWDGGKKPESIQVCYLFKDGEKPIQLLGKELVDPKRNV